MLERWIANTKKVLARDRKTGTEYEFESVFPDGAPDGTAFSATEMNKIIDAINAAEPVTATLTALNGFRFNETNPPKAVKKPGGIVHVQFYASQSGATNRVITRLPEGMYDNDSHVFLGTGTSNNEAYPMIVSSNGYISFNGGATTEVCVNASFVIS